MVEPISFVLGVVAERVFDALAGDVPKALWSKLRGDPAQNALKQSLGNAVRRYATGDRLALARPLLVRGGVLTDTEVAKEIAQVIQFGRDPNVELIGEKWRAALADQSSGRDFTEEAQRLLSYLENELRGTQVFRDVFTAKSLNGIAESVTVSAGYLADIESQLAALVDLMSSRFGDLMQTYALVTPPIRGQIRDYTRFIEEKTRGFVGRQFVFDAIGQFTQAHPRGYFFVRGDPGIGKSSLAAQLVKTSGCVHHFNSRAEGINKAATFLSNICAQLIAVYALDYTVLPPEATEDAGFLNRLLNEASTRLGASDKVIIVIDALDEGDTLGMRPGVNPLYLPITLPPQVYMVITSRKDPINLRIECEQDSLGIEQDAEGNIADIREFVVDAAERPGIRAYIAAQSISTSHFVKHMVKRSQGNFMYLRYVLPEVEHGVYTNLGVDAVPVGLQSYYEDHWQRMRGQSEEVWFQYGLPIIVALTVVKEPVSIDLIMEFSKVRERSRVVDVLQKWAAFLYEEQVEHENDLQKRYRIYHSSFHDFMARKGEVEGERVDLRAAHAQIADTLWSELFDDE